ncbi:stage II sporulation protein M [Chloroflexota bacterium]
MRYRWWLAIAFCLFAVGMVLGLTLAGELSGFLAQDIAVLKELAASLGPFKISTAFFILLKNVTALLFSFIFSPILCLTPVLSLTVNGGLLSFISALVVQERSLGFVLLAILPHGVFEIPALIIGGAASLSFGVAAMLAVVSPRKREQLLPNLKKNLRYLIIAGILLVPAAIIETFITPLLVS